MPAQSEYLVIKAVKSSSADPEKDQVGVAELRRLMQEQTAGEKSDAILADFADYLKLQVNEETTHKAFSYITKTTQENADEE